MDHFPVIVSAVVQDISVHLTSSLKQALACLTALPLDRTIIWKMESVWTWPMAVINHAISVLDPILKNVPPVLLIITSYFSLVRQAHASQIVRTTTLITSLKTGRVFCVRRILSFRENRPHRIHIVLSFCCLMSLSLTVSAGDVRLESERPCFWVPRDIVKWVQYRDDSTISRSGQHYRNHLESSSRSPRRRSKNSSQQSIRVFIECEGSIQSTN